MIRETLTINGATEEHMRIRSVPSYNEVKVVSQSNDKKTSTSWSKLLMSMDLPIGIGNVKYHPCSTRCYYPEFHRISEMPRTNLVIKHRRETEHYVPEHNLKWLPLYAM